LTLDRAFLKASGTVALYRLGDGTWRVESVAAKRGLRPWSRVVEAPPGAARREDGRGREEPPREANGIGRYAAPAAFADAFDPAEAARPEIEDEP
jgi:hypothetical protein